MAWPFDSLARLFRDAKPAPNVRSFDAASGRRVQRPFGRINPEIAAAADTVARGARYHRHNNPWIANGVENSKAALVGTGLRPTPKGLTPEAGQAVTAAFESWNEVADVTGRHDFFGLHTLIAEHLIVDGEAVVLLHPEADGLRLQVLDPSQLDRTRNADLGNGRVIAQGVELDARGRPVAYYISPERPHGDFTTWAGESQRVPADLVLHIFRPLAAGQVRGISALAPAILTANELDQLSDAMLVQAKTSALLSVFYVNQNDLTGGSPFPDADGGETADLSLEPGTARVLPAGWDVRTLTPESVRDFPAFATMTLRALAAALGIPEHYLSGDLSNANYSSLRAGLLPFYRRIEAIQYGVLVPQLLAPIWRQWLALEIVAGRLDVPADTRAEWIPPKQPWVDPAKDVAAVKEALALGLTSRTQAVAALGWDVAALDAEIAADREREAALGLNFSTTKEGSE